ncbi:MAG: RNA-binding protein [Leptolyngbyaceae cyanobacterium SM1_1_3]|nr:RNA-binding protein [Leptolyngbyaceae cyanobacterium SM1_1_3]NJM85742.1 RNA-binding protein [Leptolyngbyaceae cyanobacterium RM2_2_21]NJN04987.1 RNA-binding protein [Leptolyngbyaceae cyanobacterium RM1_1_2]NJO08931.1 RNA-binding protein [Leptolyngbyaceae cyanobacterium SL_1_1]
MSVRLYVGNLPKELEREELEAVFADHTEDLVSVKLISDRKTGKCRGFGFVTVKTDEQADVLVEKFNGYQLQDTTLKIEKALPRSKSAKPEGDVAESSTPAPSRRNKGGSKGDNKGRTTPAVTASTDAVQPDPRWAGELEKLKEMLAAQTTSS